MLGLGIGLGFNRVIGGFDADYKAVLDYMTTQGYTLPSASTQKSQNQLVVDLKSAGIWDKLDAFSVFATDGDSDAALVDWIRLTTQTAVNSPTFTSLEGFTGDGASAYIDTLYNPSTDGANYTLNSASYGYYARSHGNELTSRLGAVESQEFFRSSSTDFLRLNNSSIAGANWDNTLPVGMIHINRSSSSIQLYYKDGVSTGTPPVSTNSNALDTINFYALGRNSSGSLSNPTTGQLSVIHMGGDLSAEASDFYTAIQTYMTAIGKEV